MSFIAVLLSLLLDNAARPFEHWRGPRWFRAYFDTLRGFAGNRSLARAAAAVLLVVLVPAVVALIVGHLLAHIWAGLGLLFAAAVLLLTLGPRDLHAEARAYIEAVRAGDANRAATLARELIGTEPPAEEQARMQAVIRTVLAEANDRLFAVIFWFALLGPAGAVLYRSVDFLRRLPPEQSGSPEFAAAAARLHGILAWAPAHLAAAGYALTGSFEQAVSELRNYYRASTLRFFESSAEVPVCAGLGALAGILGESGAEQLRAALALVRRTLILWLVVYALIALFGWTW